MWVLLVEHRVQDYRQWKAAFDGDAAMRKAGGERSYRIFRSLQDPNDLTLLFEWEDLATFQKYAQSPELQEAQRKAGLLSQPRAYVLELAEHGLP